MDEGSVHKKTRLMAGFFMPVARRAPDRLRID